MPRKVVASSYVTTDGDIDEPGAWSFPFWPDEAAQFTAQALLASDALLLGRLTYEGFAAAWPTKEACAHAMSWHDQRVRQGGETPRIGAVERDTVRAYGH